MVYEELFVILHHFVSYISFFIIWGGK